MAKTEIYSRETRLFKKPKLSQLSQKQVHALALESLSQHKRTEQQWGKVFSRQDLGCPAVCRRQQQQH